jgi:hypothetical protein
VGVSVAYARADHSHPTLKADDLSDVTVATPVAGQVLRWNGTAFVNVALGYADLTGAPAAATVAPLANAAAAVVGTSTAYARQDHQHPQQALKADDLSDVAVTAPAAGQVLRWNGTNFVNVALAYTDIAGTPAIPAAITPSATAGLAGTAGGTVGVSALYARADHTHPSGPGLALYAASKVLDATDIGKMIMNISTTGTAVTFTLPGDAVMPVGTKLEIYDASSTANTYLAPQAGQSMVYTSNTNKGTIGGGVITNTNGTFLINGPFFRITAIKTQANRWMLFVA